ncbi:MAG: hypothetical protein NWE89_13635 [Candidatus Bathyarchaeota archaeon]|nr:hypothetical protein [Candidatus Bathyarchaeota archaeon]
MPIVIALRDPQINLIVEGEIKNDDATAKEYDALFPNLMVRDQEGNNMVIPLSMDCNIAFLKEATQEQIDKRKKEAEERRKAAGGGPGRGGVITTPEYAFPQGGRRGRG